MTRKLPGGLIPLERHVEEVKEALKALAHQQRVVGGSGKGADLVEHLLQGILVEVSRKVL